MTNLYCVIKNAERKELVKDKRKKAKEYKIQDKTDNKNKHNTNN